MRTIQNKIAQTLSLLILASTLGACGRNHPQYGPVAPIGYGSSAAAIANCAPPAGVLDKRVIGSLGNGAYLAMEIYSQPSGTIAANGELVIPNVNSLFGSVFTGQPGPGVNGSQEFRDCLSSNAAVGTIDRTSTYQNIQIALRGARSYIELGSNYGVQSYITGDSMEGSVYVEINGAPGSVFTMLRP
jgi:hypothetical protein